MGFIVSGYKFPLGDIWKWLEGYAMHLKKFSPVEQATWRKLFKIQTPKRELQKHGVFLNGLDILKITEEEVPNLDFVNKELLRLTGFQGVPVEGLETPRDFFAMLAERKFPVGNFIRSNDDLSYTPAPDVFHDLYGHIPFLTNLEYANFCYGFGKRAMRYAQRPDILNQFDRLFWFAVEFPLIKTSKGDRIFGSGIASSFIECEFALSRKPKVEPFDVNIIRQTSFRIDTLQERLFILENTEQLYSCLDAFENGIHERKRD